MSMAYFGWKHYPGFSEMTRAFTLQIMIALEVLALVVLSIGSVAVKDGVGWLILF